MCSMKTAPPSVSANAAMSSDKPIAWVSLTPTGAWATSCRLDPSYTHTPLPCTSATAANVPTAATPPGCGGPAGSEPTTAPRTDEDHTTALFIGDHDRSIVWRGRVMGAAAHPCCGRDHAAVSQTQLRQLVGRLQRRQHRPVSPAQPQMPGGTSSGDDLAHRPGAGVEQNDLVGIAYRDRPDTGGAHHDALRSVADGHHQSRRRHRRRRRGPRFRGRGVGHRSHRYRRGSGGGVGPRRDAPEQPAISSTSTGVNTSAARGVIIAFCLRVVTLNRPRCFARTASTPAQTRNTAYRPAPSE